VSPHAVTMSPHAVQYYAAVLRLLKEARADSPARQYEALRVALIQRLEGEGEAAQDQPEAAAVLADLADRRTRKARRQGGRVA
jgi:hypothetical protein